MTALDLAEFLVHRMYASGSTPESMAAHSGIPLRTIRCYVERLVHSDLEAAARVMTLFELTGTRLQRRSHHAANVPRVTRPAPD